jgi:translation initiation factor 2 beta subunit (eIF-2beta)/eIF-5
MFIEIEEKKEKSIAVKQKILKNINNVLNRYDSIYLKCDKVEFDNTILIDTLQKNIKEMEEEIEKNVEV